jgi:hypothetical protein
MLGVPPNSNPKIAGTSPKLSDVQNWFGCWMICPRAAVDFLLSYKASFKRIASTKTGADTDGKEAVQQLSRYGD